MCAHVCACVFIKHTYRVVSREGCVLHSRKTGHTYLRPLCNHAQSVESTPRESLKLFVFHAAARRHKCQAYFGRIEWSFSEQVRVKNEYLKYSVANPSSIHESVLGGPTYDLC